MKGKQLIFFLVFLIASCKVTENNIIGVYRFDDADQQTLKLNSDHTFLYQDINFAKEIIGHNEIDSCQFDASGTWMLNREGLTLNSFDKSFSDTSRVRDIAKSAIESNMSNFSFQDIFGNQIDFNQIDDEKETFAYIVDKMYSDYDIDLRKHKMLTFYILGHKPINFLVKDMMGAKYRITVASYYRQGYFNCRKLRVKRNRLFDKKIKYKRVLPVKNIISEYVVHGPLHH